MSANHHGQSDATLCKESLFGHCLGWSINHSGAGPFFVFDLNAGAGANASKGMAVRGSPIIAFDLLHRRKRPGVLFACDSHHGRLHELRQRMGRTPDLFGGSGVDVHFLHMTNARLAATIPERIREAGSAPRTAVGIVIADPNGLHVPTTDMRTAIAAVPNVDVLIHLGSARQQWAWRRRHVGAEKFIYGRDTVESLWDIFSIGKRFWLIAEISQNRGHHILYGSNTWMPALLKTYLPPMVHHDSLAGKALIARLHGVEQAEDATCRAS